MESIKQSKSINLSIKHNYIAPKSSAGPLAAKFCWVHQKVLVLENIIPIKYFTTIWQYLFFFKFQRGLFEDISVGIKQCDVVVACVSKEVSVIVSP